MRREREAVHWTAPSSQQQSPSYTPQCTSSCFAAPSPLRTHNTHSSDAQPYSAPGQTVRCLGVGAQERACATSQAHEQERSCACPRGAGGSPSIDRASSSRIQLSRPIQKQKNSCLTVGDRLRTCFCLRVCVRARDRYGPVRGGAWGGLSRTANQREQRERLDTGHECWRKRGDKAL